MNQYLIKLKIKKLKILRFNLSNKKNKFFYLLIKFFIYGRHKYPIRRFWKSGNKFK